MNELPTGGYRESALEVVILCLPSEVEEGSDPDYGGGACK